MSTCTRSRNNRDSSCDTTDAPVIVQSTDIQHNETSSDRPASNCTVQLVGRLMRTFAKVSARASARLIISKCTRTTLATRVRAGLPGVWAYAVEHAACMAAALISSATLRDKCHFFMYHTPDNYTYNVVQVQLQLQ